MIRRVSDKPLSTHILNPIKYNNKEKSYSDLIVYN